ncbi:MAG: YjdF family protein [Oscillospiraceae bacterium]|nr:YjdF family protein [Oscillospiraceae bacterium]
MGTSVSRLTVLFEDPFWIGLYERMDGGRYAVCKITFGAEPKDYEVYDFLLQNWNRLRFSSSIEAAAIEERRVNPKRMQRQVRRELTAGIGTKAQQALKYQQVECKQTRRTRSREQREEDAQRKFDLRQEKRKEKHRGH